jgi:hypothetical protein
MRGASLDERPEISLTYTYLIAKHQNTGSTISDELLANKHYLSAYACVISKHVCASVISLKYCWGTEMDEVPGILRINYM